MKWQDTLALRSRMRGLAQGKIFESGPPKAVHLSRHKWPGGLREGICCHLNTTRNKRGARGESGAGLEVVPTPIRCRANFEHIRQSRPDHGLGFQVNVLQTFLVMPPLLGSGTWVPRS